jgi:hypothetical protein
MLLDSEGVELHQFTAAAAPGVESLGDRSLTFVGPLS